MPSFEEISAWTIDDIIANTAHILPAGWKYDHGPDPERGLWFSKFLRPDPETDSMVPEWEEWGVDRRILLLDAFGWLAAHRRGPLPSEAHGTWIRRAEIDLKTVTRRAQTGFVPDPEDLDPDEINSVYSSARGGK